LTAALVAETAESVNAEETAAEIESPSGAEPDVVVAGPTG
jgi:hypothetical protein